MIKYKLNCKKCNHSFDSWFANSNEFERIKKVKLLSCNLCHSKKNKLKINYLCSSPEKLKIKKKFDVVLNMEIVEHVEDIDFFLKSCSKLLKKNGLMFVATINKTLKSYVFAIVGAEYVLRLLPIGTHEWEKFV